MRKLNLTNKEIAIICVALQHYGKCPLSCLSLNSDIKELIKSVQKQQKG